MVRLDRRTYVLEMVPPELLDPRGVDPVSAAGEVGGGAVREALVAAEEQAL